MLLPIRRISYQRGFTLLELVVVILIMGLLTLNFAPHSLSLSTFYARGFHDETLALLRYAQKSAISHRRTVCVEFSGDVSVSLRISASAGTSTCTNALQGLVGGNASTAAVTAQSDVSYSVVPGNFSFDGLGQPVDGSGALTATQSIQVVNASNSITVEAVTGYIHE
jgi:MSHA pilin protein MshC